MYMESSVLSLSCVRLFATPWTAARQATLSIANSRSLLKFMFIELVMSSNHLVLCCPLLFLSPIFLSTWVFSSELALCIRWLEYWSFKLQHLSFPISWSLLKLVPIESVMPCSHLILCNLLLLLPSIFPSIRVLSNEFGSLYQVAKVLELQLQRQSFQWIFRVDFL